MNRSLIIIPSIHILALITISLDLPYLRQIIVFIYLTFFPGFILLKFLKLKKTKIVDITLFSIGLSLAFLMFVGFLINEFLLFVGISQPLSTIPLEISLSMLTLSLFFIGYRRDLFEDLGSWRNNLADPRETILKSAILLLPILFSIIGALYISLPSISTPILYLMIILIGALFVVGGISLRLIPFKYYPLMIFAISIALAFQVLFISGHIIGADAQLEYQIFNLTINRGYWTLLPHSISLGAAMDYNSMLSLTVLPSIFSVLLNLDGEILFKTLYPFIFSLLPVVLYRVYEQQIGKASSLLATLFLISSPLSFYGVEFLSLDRQIVAVFFFVLSVLVLLDKIMPLEKRRILFVVFSAALIVSHYSTAYLYLGFLFVTYAILRITGENNKVLSGKIVLLVSSIGFVWYAFTESPLITLGNFLNRFFSRFSQDLVSTTSRSTQVFAPHSILTFASVINWVLFFLVHFMILVGVLVVIFKLSKKAKLDTTYRVLLIISSVILFMCLAVPNIAPALNFTRFYQLSLMFLAPCFVLGGHAFVDIFTNLLRRATRKSFLWNTHKIGAILICVVLVGYFFSQSGLINSVTKAAPLSYSLDFNRFITSKDPSYKAQIYSAYIPEQNFFSAKWLSEHSQPQSIVYADYDSLQTALLSYGVLTWESYELHSATILGQNSYVYLSKLNVKDGILTVTEPTMGWFNTSELSSTLGKSDLIYSNGNGEIWYVPPSG
jgi:uncharacterized membrane protein